MKGHEHFHYNNTNSLGTFQGEIDAIMNQVSHSTYRATSQEHKMNTANYLYQQWENLGIANSPGHERLDAYSLGDF